MTTDIGGLPLVEIRFDENGDTDPDAARALNATLDELHPTDLLVFAHGWNNTPSMADSFYRAFFGLLAPLLASYAVPDRKVLLLGVFWPSMRWSDEPIPDFTPAAAVDLAVGGGADLAPVAEFPPAAPPGATLRSAIRAAFPPALHATVDELLSLLVARPDDAVALGRAGTLTAALASASGTGGDGEQDDRAPALTTPGTEGFARFSTALEQLGTVTGAATGIGDEIGRLWHGAQEVARQLTYWQMKQRAGTIGQRGLGPFLGTLLARRPELRIGLIGHSFGARVVSYALAGLPAAAVVDSVTLLEGAFSHFAFAAALPFAANRSGALHGAEARVRGPVIACYSRYDYSVGVLYPLASMLADDDAAGFDDETYRWGGLGHDGHQPPALVAALRAVGESYGFGPGLLSIDASAVVRNGAPPSGAHSDIIHPELAWIVLSAAGLVVTPALVEPAGA